MAHYSIQAIDIFIQEIAAANGWHLGDVVEFQVKNCAWESRIELQMKTSQFGSSEFLGKQIFQAGDQEKMLQDQEITLMALQAHLAGHQYDSHPIRWITSD